MTKKIGEVLWLSFWVCFLVAVVMESRLRWYVYQELPREIDERIRVQKASTQVVVDEVNEQAAVICNRLSKLEEKIEALSQPDEKVGQNR